MVIFTPFLSHFSTEKAIVRECMISLGTFLAQTFTSYQVTWPGVIWAITLVHKMPYGHHNMAIFHCQNTHKWQDTVSTLVHCYRHLTTFAASQ